MVAGKGLDGKNPPPGFELVCEVIFDTTREIDLVEFRNASTNPVLRNFINRTLSAVWDRRLARTLKYRRLALLPTETNKGDVIYVLYGYSVPVVLRKTNDRTTSGNDLWELIGECYVYEMMDGEALVTRREEEMREPEFLQELERV
jgi:hypothetical protein